MKYKFGDSVMIKIPDNPFNGLIGEVLEFDKKIGMYMVIINEPGRTKVGVIEKFLDKVK